MQSDRLRRGEIVLLAIACEGGLGALAWFLGWCLGEPPLKTLRWSGCDALLGAAGSVPLLLVFVLCLRLPIRPLERIRSLADGIIGPLFRPCSVLELALISLLAGFGEEMLFRGFLQRMLTNRLGVWLGAIAANVLFGLAHLITPAYAVIAMSMGLYLGWLWMSSDNLLTAIVTHALYDFLALVYIARFRKTGN